MSDYIWLIVLALAILIELITVGNILFIWFGFGALAAWVSQLLGLSWQIQVIVFSLVTLISLIFVRPLTTSYLRGEIVSTNIDRIVGQQFRLEKDLKNDEWYQQRIDNNLWSIVEVNRNELPANTLVEIIAIEGVKLVVKAINNKEDL